MNHWLMLNGTQREALEKEFPEEDGWELEDIHLGPYNEACHICDDPIPKGQTQEDRIWIYCGDNLKVICIDRPGCHARVSIKRHEAENIAKDIARRVEV